MKLEQYLKHIETFLNDYLEKTHCAKYILGISGGVDSSLCAALARNAVGKERLKCLVLPISSLEADALDAIRLAKELDLDYQVIDATSVFNEYIKSFKQVNLELDRSTLGNLKARMRMSILYAIAQNENGLVIGTDNADERYVGYFTKYGDGACDVLPIAHLVKSEVVEAARLLGVSEHLATRVPSAGLYEGQTDEIEMGVKYVDLDAYVLGKEINEEAQKRIAYLHKISEHKRKEIPMPIAFKRDD